MNSIGKKSTNIWKIHKFWEHMYQYWEKIRIPGANLQILEDNFQNSGKDNSVYESFLRRLVL
jgi:hypothetical protein